MERAKMSVRKTKKDKFHIVIKFENNTSMPLNKPIKNVESFVDNEVEVIVEREGGQIKSVKYNGEELIKTEDNKVSYNPKSSIDNRTEKIKDSHKEKKSNNNSGSDNNTCSATAPYNFVPLNEKVIEAESIPVFNKYHEDRYTGYIDLEIKTLTPIYIRDTLSLEEYKRKEEFGENKNFINPDFFSPGGIIRIPSSSLRGMIRTLVEIVSFSKLEFFEKDKKFYFRSFADKSLDLRSEYSKYMIKKDNHGFYPKVKAGYLKKEGLDYYIIPAKEVNGTQYFRIEEKDALRCKVIKEPMKIKKYVCDGNNENKDKLIFTSPGLCPKCKSQLKEKYFVNPRYNIGFKKIKFIPTTLNKYKHSNVYLYYAKVNQIWDFNDGNAPTNAIEGSLVLSNWVGGKREGKHMHWIIGPIDDSKKIKIDADVLKDYKNDLFRDKDCNLLRYFENNNINCVPCFYLEDGGKIISFGHTGMFRLPYKKSLKELMPSEHLNNKIDLTNAIFGDEVNFASRVFFEDLYLNLPLNGELAETSIPKILSTPKPTSFQLYLNQDEKSLQRDTNGNISGLKNYNSETTLRGFKLYWHRKADKWIEEEISFEKKGFKEFLESKKLDENYFEGYLEDNEDKITIRLTDIPSEKKLVLYDAIGIYETQHTLITPVKEGSIFKGRIRFENLSDVELGALLFVLDLPEGLSHKIGMAKPLGLGSIQIKPSLFMSKRSERYKKLWAEWDGLEKVKEEKIKCLKASFQSYILNKLGENKQSLWELDRIKQLEKILSWSEKPENNKTEYMKVECFRGRDVLPTPEKVLNSNKKNV